MIFFKIYYFARSKNEPSLVSITILSSVFMKSGTRTSIPVSKVAGFNDFPEVSPFTPGSQYVTVRF